MTEADVFNVVKDRTVELLRVLATLVVDSLFLAGVILINYAVQHFVADKLKLGGSAKMAVETLEWILAVATVVPVIAYVVNDTAVAVARPFRRHRGKVSP